MTPTIFIVVDEEGIQSSKKTFKKASKVAVDLKEKDAKTEVVILEVVKAWTCEYPEEPNPEISEIELDSIT